jgi:hypothetical protein
MSPKSTNFQLSTLKRDERRPLAMKDASFRPLPNQMTPYGSSQKPGQPDSMSLQVTSEPGQKDFDTSIWED